MHLLPSLFCRLAAAVRNRGAVRLIRARVQQEIRWAFATSCVSHTNSTEHKVKEALCTHTVARWLLRREYKELEWKRSLAKCSFISVNQLNSTEPMLYKFYFCFSLGLWLISLLVVHAVLCFNRAPVVDSGFCFTLGSITFCHLHHWCCCWDISLCLNPSCVVKVPLCISSPSLSENLSCPLMGVCWWVWLIVGYGLLCFFFLLFFFFLPAVTPLPIVWCSPALL